jgi:hypothetical protein
MSERLGSERVGYKHPPREHQFRPGQSGNPAGRPKGARSLRTDLREELAELMPFGEGDQAVELSKQRVLVKNLVAAAIAGDPRAMATVLSLASRASGEDEQERDEPPEDSEIMQVVAARSTKRRSGKAAAGRSDAAEARKDEE